MKLIATTFADGDVSIQCVLPTSEISKYPGGFRIVVAAETIWPVQPGTTFFTEFKAF